MFTSVSVGSYTGFAPSYSLLLCEQGILGDPWADSGGEGKCKHSLFFFAPLFFARLHSPPRNYLPLGLRGCFKMCKAQLFSRSEFTSKSPFLCVNKIPVVSGLFFFSFFFIKLCLIIYRNPWSKPKG